MSKEEVGVWLCNINFLVYLQTFLRSVPSRYKIRIIKLINDIKKIMIQNKIVDMKFRASIARFDINYFESMVFEINVIKSKEDFSKRLSNVCKSKKIVTDFLSHPSILMEKTLSTNYFQSTIYPNPLRIYPRQSIRHKMFQEIVVLLLIHNSESLIIGKPKRTSKSYTHMNLSHIHDLLRETIKSYVQI